MDFYLFDAARRVTPLGELQNPAKRMKDGRSNDFVAETSLQAFSRVL